MSSLDQKRVLFSGNEALAQGAYEAGVKVAAAYPGTPSTEILQYLARFNEIDSQWSVNEKVAFEVALGAAIGGARALYASKHVGINVAMDPMMTSAYTGINAGFVIVCCDDPGLHSSQNEQDNRILAQAAKIPLLEPSSAQEAYFFVKEAFRVSEEFDTPVFLRMTTRICHAKEDIVIGKRKEVPAKPFHIDVAKYVMVPGNAYRRHIVLEKRLEELKNFSNTSNLNSAEIKDTKIGVITSGSSYLYVKEMMPQVSVLKLGMSFPFPDDLVKTFASKVEKVFVIEELDSFLEDKVKALGIKCIGKDKSFCIGELRPEHIPLIVEGKTREPEIASGRKPSLCPGCGHRMVFNVLKELKVTVSGDIGCYTLGVLPPFSSIHTCVCMGAGVTIFEGLKRANNHNVVGVIGDSTFVHSGITGLINAAYNKVTGVVIILDNSITAMTGGQPHPGVGTTLKGEKTKALSLEKIAQASGADYVDVIDPAKMNDFKKLLKKRMGQKKLSVIIARRVCKLLTDKQKKQKLKFHANKS
jgi:indolepyruvate ferredoxin oxidoreductase alpha subunit